MLRIHQVGLLFALIMVGMLVIDFTSYDLPGWTYAVLPAIFVGMAAYGSLNICSGFFVRAICAAETSEKVIALTFDDGPDPLVTPQVLDLLEDFGASATFFCIGRRISGQEELLKRIHNEGHLIGNHTYSHHYLIDLFPASAIRREIHRTSELVNRIIGRRPRWFRPPYGITNPAIATAVRKEDVQVIGWNRRSFDTVQKDPQKVLKRVLPKLQPGDVILFHDTDPRLVPLLRRFLEEVTAQGYRCERLDRLINRYPYENSNLDSSPRVSADR